MTFAFSFSETTIVRLPFIPKPVTLLFHFTHSPMGSNQAGTNHLPPSTSPYLPSSLLERNTYFCSNASILHWILLCSPIWDIASAINGSFSCITYFSVWTGWFSPAYKHTYYHLSKQQQNPPIAHNKSSQNHRSHCLTCSPLILGLPYSVQFHSFSPKMM